jgi:DNA-binding PadR family transcriptional regulator
LLEYSSDDNAPEGKPTNVTRLVILWLLSESPLHGYQVKRILGDPGLQFWFPIEFGSIYSVLRSLQKEGYARAVAIERAGNRPRRTRYAITPRGRTYFAALLRAAWRRPASPTQPVDLALAATPELPEEELPELLAARRAALIERLADIDRIRRSAPSAAMVERAKVLTEAELQWLDRFISERNAERGGGE